MRLAGKRAFVSGAGGGIGEAAALKFAREGARIIASEQADVPARLAATTPAYRAA